MTLATFLRSRPLLFALGIVAGRALCVLRHAAPRNHHRATLDDADDADADDAIIVSDASRTIVLANRAAADMFASTMQQMRGAPLARFIPQADALALRARDDGAARSAGRRAIDQAVTGLKAGGQPFPLEASLSRRHTRGQSVTTIILRDVSERKLAEARLAQSHAQLRKLSSALQTIREEERSYIARELHDDLGQLLATLRMDLTLLRQASGERSVQLLNGMDERLMGAIVALRRIAARLRPRALDEGGLYFALHNLRAEFVARHAIACELDVLDTELTLDDERSTAIYRIVQEALTNVARHAQARKVRISVRRDDAHLRIVIGDDGRGINEAAMDKPASLGLIGMRERVQNLAGEMTITGSEAQGTRIDIVLPLHPDRSGCDGI